VLAGGRKEDESFEAGRQLGDNGAKAFGVGLDGEDDGDGFGRPRGDLERVGRGEWRDFGFAGEGFGDGAGELVPVEFQRRDSGEGQGYIRADVAAADAVDLAVLIMEKAIGANGGVRADEGGGLEIAVSEGEGLEAFKMFAELGQPNGWEGQEAGERFEGFPKHLRASIWDDKGPAATEDAT